MAFARGLRGAGGKQRAAGRRRGCGQQKVQIPGPQMGRPQGLPCGLRGCGGGQSNAPPAGAVVAANRRFKSLGRKWKRPQGFALWPSWLRGGAKQRGAGRRRGCGQQKVQIPGPQMEKATGLSPCGLRGCGGARQRGAGRRRGCGQQKVQIPGPQMEKATWLSPCGLRGCGQSNAAPAGAVVAANRRFKSLGRKWKGPQGFTLRPSWLRGGDLNPRPLGYEPNELPDCSTPRHRGAPTHPTNQRYHARPGRSNDACPAALLPRRGRAYFRLGGVTSWMMNSRSPGLISPSSRLAISSMAVGILARAAGSARGAGRSRASWPRPPLRAGA